MVVVRCVTEVAAGLLLLPPTVLAEVCFAASSDRPLKLNHSKDSSHKESMEMPLTARNVVHVIST